MLGAPRRCAAPAPPSPRARDRRRLVRARPTTGGRRCSARQARHLVSRFSYGITPALAADVREAGGARAWFEQQLAPAVGRPTPASRSSATGGHPASVPLPAPTLWQRQSRRGRGRLGGDGQLRALGARAPDPVAPPGPRGDARVLGEPLQRPRQRRRRVHLAHRLRRRARRARARLLRGPAADRDHAPGDADLPRQRRLHRQAPQREPRPRAARAAHRRPRQLRRGRRQELRPDPHRLAGRRCGSRGSRRTASKDHWRGPVKVHGLHPRQRRTPTAGR